MTETPVGLRIGVVMPAEVKSSSRQIMRFAHHVEDFGLDGIFVGDHLAAATAQPDSTLTLALLTLADRTLHSRRDHPSTASCAR